MVKELCFRCKRPVYPTDKVGPLKDGAYFHNGCFKCYICGTRLALRSYCHNRNNIEDQEVYCTNHAPQANPHDPIPHRSNLLASPRSGSGSGVNNGGAQTGLAPDRAGGAANGGGNHGNGNGSRSPEHQQYHGENNNGGIGDIKIAHALKATEIQKPYPKIVHPGAKYTVDYDIQTRLELIHRTEEDALYQTFSKQRQEEEQRFSHEIKEEWEKALGEFAKKYERETQKATGNKAREDLIRQLTVKRDKRRETMQSKWRERERSMTAELVEKQSREMMDLFRQARKQQGFDNESTTADQQQTNGHFVSPVSNGGSHQSSSTTTHHHHHHHHHHTNQLNSQTVNGGSTSTNQEAVVNGVYPSTPPPPFPPVGRKRDVYSDAEVFHSVDQIAISVAQSELHSFTDLMRALTGNCKSDVEKARAIYRWITVKNLNVIDFNHSMDPNTPMGILRGIKYGTESYHVLFKRLCSYAGLHCVVIKGYSKSAGYQPGMHFEDNRFRNTWNAVFLEGGWRFVQCNWGARHLVNARDIPYPGGRAVGSVENLRYEYDDHYFMTDPEEFIYEFYPSQTEWQLLKRPITLAEFENLPFVRSLFFRYGLTFADPNMKSVVYADSTGAATVAVNVSPEAISNLIFHYNLRFYNNEEQEFNKINLKRFVMQSVVGHSVVFRVHTPCRGEFLLDVFANAVSAGEYLTGQPMKFKSVCKFKAVCDHLNVIMVPLPECASGEWGPAKAYRLFGMVPATHEDAIINAGKELEIRFRMSKSLAEFVASLHKNLTDDRKLSKFVQQSIRGDQVVLRLSFPEEGQYGLDIYTRESGNSAAPNRQQQAGERHLLTHCCKYLINARL